MYKPHLPVNNDLKHLYLMAYQMIGFKVNYPVSCLGSDPGNPVVQGNEMCIRSAEFYLYEQEELSFLDIMVRARERDEIVIGYRLANTDEAIINPEHKSEIKKWSLDDMFVVIAKGD